MKIIFICSSLEAGKDGVGDYTRKLAAALTKTGWQTAIIAINDRRMQAEIWEGEQYEEGVAVKVLRLAESLPWATRLDKAKGFAEQVQPDWFSLQYVPFGYQLKGLPFELGKRLIHISGKLRWHIMFHELSVNRYDSFKFRIWATLQMRIIRHLVAKLKPLVIHTNTELYRYRLKEMGFPAAVLPLFSNISRVSPEDKKMYDELVPSFIAKHRGNYIIGTLFGNFDFKRWDMRSLLDKFTYGFSKKRVVFASIGQMSGGQQCWEQLKKDYPQVVFLSLSQQSPGFISWWLTHYTDFGILTTLPELAGKSGSFMAFKEHGVPVVCREKTPALQSLNLPAEQGLIEISPGKRFKLPAKQAPVSELQHVSHLFMHALSLAAKRMSPVIN